MAGDGRRRAKEGPPSAWVTSLSGLLSGDSECKYRGWFKAHWWYDGIEDKTFDKAGWTSDHTAMVNKRAERLRSEGWEVTVESANKFRLVGQIGNVEGKCDIVAKRFEAGALVAIRVEDCKTGRERNADWWQVLIYVYDQQRRNPGVSVEGAVVYKGGPPAEPWCGLRLLNVLQADLTRERVAELGGVMRVLCAEQAPVAAPSWRECSRCDIPFEHCSARLRGPDDGTATATTEDF